MGKPLAVTAALVVLALGAGQEIVSGQPPAEVHGRSMGSPDRPAAATPEVVEQVTEQEHADPGEEEAFTVTCVPEGGTFELADGRTIRIHGIEPCEVTTVAQE